MKYMNPIGKVSGQQSVKNRVTLDESIEFAISVSQDIVKKKVLEFLKTYKATIKERPGYKAEKGIIPAITRMTPIICILESPLLLRLIIPPRIYC